MYANTFLRVRTQNKSLSLAAAALLCFSVQAFCEGTPKSYAGTFYSPASTGISFHVPSKSLSFHSFDLGAELTDMLDGGSSRAGVRIGYHRMFTILHGILPSSAFPWQLYAGPGLTAGYVREHNSPLGYMGGVSAAAGLSATLRHGISLAVEYQFYTGFQTRDGVMRHFNTPAASLIIPRLRIIKSL